MRKQVLTSLLMLIATMAMAQKPIEMNLWPEGPKSSNGDPNDMAKVTVFLPNEKKATGRAIVCCPGGGYSHLAMQHEGFDWAPFFNGQGIALIVLKYRMPHGNYKVPAEDAEEAIRLVRSHAKEWHINTDDVGIMGFSAGGHLASTVATHAVGDAAPGHLHGAGYHPSRLARQPVRQEPQAQARQRVLQRAAHYQAHAPCLPGPGSRRPRRAARQQPELLRGAVCQQGACRHVYLSVRWPRLRHPTVVHLPFRDDARTEGLAAQLLTMPLLRSECYRAVSHA